MVAAASERPFPAPPIPRTRLIGRAGEIGVAHALLLEEAVPLLTLTGPGGVGKTRLALAIGHEVAEHFADGVAFVDLAPLADPDLVPATVALVLGVVTGAERSILEALIASFCRAQHLLILDNCEHVLAAAAEMISALLAACPALQVLATSRAPLHIRGEQTLPIEPLPLPPDETAATPEALGQNAAVMLFVERARAVRLSFALTNQTGPVVAAICSQLDGLPLAIELAAARLRILPVEALLDQMSDRLWLLQGGARDLPARQQTLVATIAWSYDLLSDDDQRFFRRLAVFAGGWTLDAAAAVGDLPLAATLEAIGRLVELSLVRPLGDDSEPRFTMLETIRAFALARVTEHGEEVATRDRHATWCLAFAEHAAARLSRGGETALLDRQARELDNSRAALAWLDHTGAVETRLRLAVALGWVWYVRGFLGEGQAWLERARDRSLPIPPALRAAALQEASDLALRQRDLAAAGELAAASLATWRGLDDRSSGGVIALLNLGSVASFSGDDGRAVPFYEEALALARTQDQPMLVAVALNNLAEVALNRGDPAATEVFALEAVALQRELGRPLAAGSPWTLALLGEVAVAGGDLAAAADQYRASIALALEYGDAGVAAVGLVGLGVVATALGAPLQAARLFGAAEGLRQIGGAPAPRSMRRGYQSALSAIRVDLGEAAFAAAWAVGVTLAVDAALAEADAIVAAVEIGDALVSVPTPVAGASPRGAPLPAASAAEFALTFREQEILALLAQRLTNSEIAARLFISPKTTENHVGNILGKLGAANRREAAVIAVRHGLI